LNRPAFIGLDEFDTFGVDAASRIGPVRGEGGRDASGTAVEAKPSPTEASVSAPVSDLLVDLVADLVPAVAGLSPVDWPFVNAEDVRCGVDAAGRLHLMCRDVDHGQLGIARAWAVAHARQLSKCAGITEAAASEPVLHVVTEHAPRVANLHRTGVHLHLVVDGDGGRRTMPLNDDRNREMQ
jgi:hypothetical protein